MYTRETEKWTPWYSDDETQYPANDRVGSSRLSRDHCVYTKYKTGAPRIAAGAGFKDFPS